MGTFLNSTYEKGVELEKLVAKLFRAKGYYVKHNVKLIGRSGVKHQIDVYAEYRAPLHTSKIIIECKAYDKPINKDVVMKLINEVNDLGVDRGILVTTSYFTSDAVSTASGYNVDLWDYNKLRELMGETLLEEISVPENLFYVEPKTPIKLCRERVDKGLKGLFGRKGTIESCSPIFYPFYEAEIEAKLYVKTGFVKKKIKERIVSTSILVDAVKGDLCSFSETIKSIMKIPKLTEEEAAAFKLFSLQHEVTVPGLASFLSCSTSKARKIVQGLVIKGVVEQKARGLYRSKIEIPDPSALTVLSSNIPIKALKEEIKPTLTPLLSLSDLENIVKLLWNGSVKNYKIIYYPYYACKVVEKEKKHVKAVDMIKGVIDERISETLTSLYTQLPF